MARRRRKRSHLAGGKRKCKYGVAKSGRRKGQCLKHKRAKR